MTIKFWDCVLCRNTGVYKAFRCKPLTAYGFTNEPIVDTAVAYETYEVTCNCDWGKEREIWENRMSHPEYENPLAKMSDQDLLTYLKVVDRIDQEREKIVDSEFNL